MEDIKLVRRGDTYDWQIGSNNLTPVRGIQQVVNAVIHTVLLRKGEMVQQIYKDKGSVLFDSLNNVQKPANHELIREQLLMEIRSVDGVESASITSLHAEMYDVQITIEIITRYGGATIAV